MLFSLLSSPKPAGVGCDSSPNTSGRKKGLCPTVNFVNFLVFSSKKRCSGFSASKPNTRVERKWRVNSSMESVDNREAVCSLAKHSDKGRPVVGRSEGG